MMDDVFVAHDAFLAKHPDIAQALEIVAISERRIREAQRACIIIETWRNGELVERQTLTEYLKEHGDDRRRVGG